jgi:hypothetical protein
MGRVVNLYVNGVDTDNSTATTQARNLMGLLGEPVELFYNKTNGLLSDLFSEALPGWLIGPTQIANDFYGKLNEIIQKEYYNLDYDDESELLVGNDIVDTIRIFCHSQGGLITANAISLLDEVDRKLIRVYAFASPQPFEPNGCGHYEYFWNKYDILKTHNFDKHQVNWGPRFDRHLPEPIEDPESPDEGPIEYIYPEGIPEHDFLKSYLGKLEEFEEYRESEFFKLIKKTSRLEKSQQAKNLLTISELLGIDSSQSENANSEGENNESENSDPENELAFEPGEFGEGITAFKDHPLFNCGAIPIDFKTKEIYDLVESGEAFYNKVASNIDQVKAEVQPVIDLLTSGNLTLEGWEITPPASWTGIGGTAQDITNILGQTTSLLESADEFKKMVEDFEIHTNILSGVDLVPEDKSGLYSLFTTAISWNMGSRSFGDQTDKLEKIFGSLFNGEAIMDTVKSTSENIKTATNAIDLINEIQNGTSTPTEILDELSQIGIFTDQIAQVKELIDLDELALKEAKKFFNTSGLARQLAEVYRNPCSASLPQDVFGTDPLKILL